MIVLVLIAAIVLSFVLYVSVGVYSNTYFETEFKRLIGLSILIVLAFITIVVDIYALGIILALCL